MALPVPPESGLMTVEETAKYLRLSRSKCYQLVGSGELPVVRIGKSVRIKRDRLERWVEDRSR